MEGEDLAAPTLAHHCGPSISLPQGHMIFIFPLGSFKRSLIKLLTMSLSRENKYFPLCSLNKQHSSQHIINALSILDGSGRLSFASLDSDTN